ncbi:MAG: hypothetical protein KDA68_04120 [Planctomycetaceae bacterium]|nr:hypothetical protein [Planctomycetaceae bacterium]
MLTKRQIRNDVYRRSKIVFPYLIFSFFAVLAYFPLVQFFVNPPPESTEAILLMMPAFAILVIPVVVGQSKANRIQIICPSCGRTLNGLVREILRTHTCPFCSSQIVEGKIPTKEALARHQRLIQRIQIRYVQYWVWAWPILSGVAITSDLVFPGSIKGCENVSWFPALIGIVSSCWIILRAKRWSALFPLIISLLLFSFGIWKYFL